jgi:tRNA nucleotidyltransferase (CCA-adding enzyme)
MCHSASAGSAVPFRVQAYVETIVHTCADGGRALVSVVLFGSAAIGGWVETVSDVDLILVVPVSGELLRGPILPANRAAKGSCLSLFERTW